MLVNSAAGPTEYYQYPLKQGLLMHNQVIYHSFHSGSLYLLEYIYLKLFAVYLCILL